MAKLKVSISNNTKSQRAIGGRAIGKTSTAHIANLLTLYRGQAIPWLLLY